MAIDSKAKRASAFAATVTPLLVLPPPVSGVDAGDRQHVGGFIYRGIAAAAPGGATVIVQERGMFRRVWGRVWGRVN